MKIGQLLGIDLLSEPLSSRIRKDLSHNTNTLHPAVAFKPFLKPTSEITIYHVYRNALFAYLNILYINLIMNIDFKDAPAELLQCAYDQQHIVVDRSELSYEEMIKFLDNLCSKGDLKQLDPSVMKQRNLELLYNGLIEIWHKNESQHS
jgi:hypothetical protein